MGNSFIVADVQSGEYITFHGLGKEGEIIGNKITSQMVAYFLFEHNGKEVIYIGDQWNVGIVYTNFEKMLEFGKDITTEILKEMLEEKYITEEQLDSFAPRWRESNQKETT